jgi:exopolysaccharide production protein ExoZ
MPERYISLQFLRACAAWSVVFLHYSQIYRDFDAITLLERLFTFYGGLGVDIFFVISGFIMALSLTNRPKTAAGFAWDRFVRIAPAYWVATVVFLIAIQLPLWEHIDFLTQWGWQELIYSVLFIPHEHQAGIGIIPVLTVGWTLNYEMFFYALLALGLLINTKKALPITLVTVLILPVLNKVAFNTGPIAGSFLLYEFGFGLLIFQVAVKLGQIHKRPLVLQIALGVACALIALGALKFKFQFHAADMIVAIALVLGCVCSEAVFHKVPRFITSIFMHLGNLSYSTYLLHVPAMLFVGVWVDRSRDNDPMLIMLSIAVTYVMSWISYTLIEQKLSKALKKPSPPQTAKTSVSY